MNSWSLWLKGAFVFVLSALITSVTTMSLAPEQFNFSKAGLIKVGSAALVIAVKALLLYLKQSPIPASTSAAVSNSIRGDILKSLTFVLLALLILAVPCFAQSPTPTPTPVAAPSSPEPNVGLHFVTDAGAFKLTAGGTATFAGLGVPVTKNFRAQFDTLIVPDAKKQFQFGGVRYDDVLAHLIGSKASGKLLFDPNTIQVYGGVGLGTVHGSEIPSPKFAYEFYGGINFKVGQVGGGTLDAGLRFGYFAAPRDTSGGPTRFRYGNTGGAAPVLNWSW